MNHSVICCMVIVLALASACTRSTESTGAATERDDDAVAIDLYEGIPVIAGRALVKFPGALPDSSWTKNIISPLPSPTELVRFPELGVIGIETRTVNTQRFIDLLRRTERFDYVEPDYVIRSTATIPRDGYFGKGLQWGLGKIGAPAAWECSLGSRSIVVAVVDSGFDASHFELGSNLWQAPSAFTVMIDGAPLPCKKGALGYDAADHDCDPPTSLHGTHVAATIGAAEHDKKKSVVGVNWKTSLMSVRFLVDGQAQGTTDAVAALKFVREVKRLSSPAVDIRVVNMSWGTYGESETLKTILKLLAEDKVLLVASAGNDGKDNEKEPFYPASFDDEIGTLISVAASTDADDLWGGSNYGMNVDLAAPGEDILSATVHPYHAFDSGTSMAAAYVSGAAALVAAACPGTTAVDVRTRLLAHADPLVPTPGRPIRGGRLNVANALRGCTCPERPAP